jgi:RNA polymerase sigma factor (sigma-70 family)
MIDMRGGLEVLSKELMCSDFVKAVQLTTPASMAENIDLINRLQNGDRSAEAPLMLKNGKRVLDLIEKYNFDAIIQPDLFQIGEMTIVETAKQIKNESLSWFLLHVDSKILLRFGQFLQENGEIIQMPLFCRSSAKKTIKYCDQKQEIGSMSVSELSRYFNTPETAVRKEMVFFLSENETENVCSNRYNPERIFEEKWFLSSVMDLLNMFPKRDKHLFLMRLCTDYSYKKIGQYFGLSTGRAQQIYYRVLMRLFHKMRDNHLILTENSEKKNIFVFKI